MASTLPTLTSRFLVSDFLKWEVDERYVSVAATIKNVLAAIEAGDIQPGSPLKDNGGQWETLSAANVANAEGFYADTKISPALANNATSVLKYRILKRGPALVNPSIVTVDPVGAAINQTNLRAAIRALSPTVELLLEPTNTETQTT